MDEKAEKFPDPKKVEKEISDFLSEKFGGRVKLITPVVVPREESFETEDEPPTKKLNFSLRPEQLEAYLDQYLVPFCHPAVSFYNSFCSVENLD